MKLDKESIKKFAPFLVVGGVLGVFGLLSRKGGSQDTSSLQANDEIDQQNAISGLTGVIKENQLASDQKLQEVIGQTNQAFSEQKSFYESQINSLKDLLQLNSESDKDYQNSINSIISELNNNFNNNNSSLSNELSHLEDKLNDLSNGLTPTPPPTKEEIYVPKTTVSKPQGTLTKEQTDILYKDVYNSMQNAINSGNIKDIENARKDVNLLYGTGGQFAMGEFSKQLDIATQNIGK